jgi:hypothetical protein
LVKDEPLWVLGCEWCKHFLIETNVEFIWPTKRENLKEQEFIIVKDKNGIMVIYRDHIKSITREAWGRILYRIRLLFGSGTRLRVEKNNLKEHFICRVIKTH